MMTMATATARDVLAQQEVVGQAWYAALRDDRFVFGVVLSKLRSDRGYVHYFGPSQHPATAISTEYLLRRQHLRFMKTLFMIMNNVHQSQEGFRSGIRFHHPGRVPSPYWEIFQIPKGALIHQLSS